MYDAAAVLQRIDDHLWTVVALMAFPWIGGFIQIFEALRLGFRHRVSGQPVGMTMALLAHDMTYLASVHHYLNEISHPLFVLFWFGMIPSVAIEFVLLRNWVVFRAQDFGAGLSTAATSCLALAGQGFALAAFWFLQSLLDDPLNLVGFTVVQVAAVVFLVPMILGRRSTLGQSRLFAWATLLGPASLGFLFIPYFSPSFNTPLFWLLVTIVTTLAAAYLALYERYRDQERAC